MEGALPASYAEPLELDADVAIPAAKTAPRGVVIEFPASCVNDEKEDHYAKMVDMGEEALILTIIDGVVFKTDKTTGRININLEKTSDEAKAATRVLAEHHMEVARINAKQFYFNNKDCGLNRENFESIAREALYISILKFVCGESKSSAMDQYLDGMIRSELLKAVLRRKWGPSGGRSRYKSFKKAEVAQAKLAKENGGQQPSRMEVAQAMGLTVKQVHDRLDWPARTQVSLEGLYTGLNGCVDINHQDTDVPTPEELAAAREIASNLQFLTPIQLHLLETQNTVVNSGKPIGDFAIAKHLGMKKQHLPQIRDAIRLVLDGEEPGLRDIDRKLMTARFEAGLELRLTRVRQDPHKAKRDANEWVDIFRMRHPYNGELPQGYIEIAIDFDLDSKQVPHQRNTTMEKLIRKDRRLSELFEIIHGYVL